MRKLLLLSFGLVLLITWKSWGQKVQTHPRLWIRNADLTALKAKATSSNPYFVSLKNFVSTLKVEMDAGRIPNQYDATYTEYSEYPAETTAMMFAFMSLVTDGTESQDYASRAKKLVMHIINLANQGTASGAAFRDPVYSVYDRSRWYFFGLPLAVDWVYPQFSATEKTAIRSVFLRWCDENAHANTTTDNHPEPVDVRLDPSLLVDHDSDAKSRRRIRYSANNYYLAHARNMYLMAASMDNTDDPNGLLHKYIDDVTGAWLYVTEEFFKTEGKGGLSPEGFLYGPSAYGRLAQTLLAIYTSGEADAQNTMRGIRSTFSTPLWDEIVPANFHSISPTSTTKHPWTGEGAYFMPFNYGDIQKFRVDDYMDLMGVVGWYDKISGNNASRLNMIKWFETNIPVGGKANIFQRVSGNGGAFENTLFYFLLFDPTDAPQDPRPDLPKTWYAQGIGRILSRTSWTDNASAFTFKCGYNRQDHQFADGNSFSFFRKGSFLTSPINGYGPDIGVSRNQNSVALQNNNPGEADGPLGVAYQSGSQWFLVPEFDGKISAWSDADAYLSVTGDATGLYTYINPWVTPTGNDITHASRSAVWVKPDQLIIYDRATSKTSGRYKQFWLGLPSTASVNNKTATAEAPNNQFLHVTNLLPANAVVTSQPYGNYNEPAENDPMKARLMVEDPSNPLDIRFLHVLQGKDDGQTPLATSLIKANDDSFEGSLVGDLVIMFKKNLDGQFSSFSFVAPSAAKSYLITGLTPSTNYSVSIKDQPDGTHTVAVSLGAGLLSDTGGVVSAGSITGASSSPDPCFTSSAQGRTVTFTNCSTGATSYSWDFGDKTSSTLYNPDHTYSADGTYTVTLTAQSSSQSKTLTKTVTVTRGSSKPVACFTFTAVNKNVTFSNCSTDADSYTWDFGDKTTTSSSDNPAHTYEADGIYTVTLTATSSNGTSMQSHDVIISKDNLITAIEKRPEIDLTISPNPSTGPLSIKASEPINDVAVYDLTGATVTKLNGSGQREIAINITSGRGVYIIKVSTQNTVQTQRVIIKQ